MLRRVAARARAFCVPEGKSCTAPAALLTPLLARIHGCALLSTRVATYLIVLLVLQSILQRSGSCACVMGNVLQLAVLLFSYAHALQHTYRVVFRDVHAAFRSEDVHSAAHDLGGRVEHVSTTSARLQLPDDAAAATLAERSVLVRYVLEEWGAGATLREAASRACVPPNSLLATGASWRIRVQSPGRRTGLVNAHDPVLFNELGDVLDALPGPVRLRDAEEDVAVLLRGETVVVGRVVARGCAAQLLSQSWSCVELQCYRHPVDRGAGTVSRTERTEARRRWTRHSPSSQHRSRACGPATS